jgi:SAM-dependent methyltransferase
MTVPGFAWGGGYVTDIAYMPGYYRQQSPLHLNLACLLGGAAGLDLRPGAPLSYLELACGHGFGALALAASNPAWCVTGVDFNPAHIATARALAAEAGVANVRFFEADLATVAEDRLAAEIAPADVVTMHGLWSWVADPVRAGIVRLLAAKVRPGGLVHVSYNALPSWQGALGMQRLLREVGARAVGPSDRRVAEGFEAVRALAEAKAHHLCEPGFVRMLLDHAQTAQPAYLAHEYMNAAWRPCFHADVAAALAEAKLEWVAPVQLLESFPALTMGDEARAVLARFSDPVLRELVKDMCLTRGLRQDVFVRGVRRLTPAERDAALDEVMLALLCREAEFVWEVEAPAGQATLDRRFFGPVVSALAERPRRVGELLELPDLPRRDNPAEIVGMLVGTDQALPVLAPPVDPDGCAVALNRAAARRFVQPDNIGTSMALATSGTGSPLPCPMLDLFVAAQLAQSPVPEPDGWASRFAAGRPETEKERLRLFIERLLAERAPIWRSLGALSTSP